MLYASNVGPTGTGGKAKITTFELDLPVMGKNMLSYLLAIIN